MMNGNTLRLTGLCQLYVRFYHNTAHLTCITQIQQYNAAKARNRQSQGMTELVRDFVEPAAFHKGQTDIGVSFYCGVPDSLLKDYIGYVSDNVHPDNHVITANEGGAVALATGYHLATKNIALVYLQNSGLGNAVNPLLSLADKSVYRIPMLLLIGWRGEPGKRDEPQHAVQGQVTAPILDAIGLPYEVLPDYEDGALKALHRAKETMENESCPYCLLVRRQTFAPYRKHISPNNHFSMGRESALKEVLSYIPEEDLVISTTGMLSRELYEHRVRNNQGHCQDFMTVGSMGHASMIALGVAKQAKTKRVWCLDGDGSVLMHMGALPVIGNSEVTNLKHVVFNNGCHDSVGGQSTVAMETGTSLTGIAKASGYKQAYEVASVRDLHTAMAEIKTCTGPAFIEVKVKKGHRSDVGRPSGSPIDYKDMFITHANHSIK